MLVRQKGAPGRGAFCSGMSFFFTRRKGYLHCGIPTSPLPLPNLSLAADSMAGWVRAHGVALLGIPTTRGCARYRHHGQGGCVMPVFCVANCRGYLLSRHGGADKFVSFAHIRIDAENVLRASRVFPIRVRSFPSCPICTWAHRIPPLPPPLPNTHEMLLT